VDWIQVVHNEVKRRHFVSGVFKLKVLITDKCDRLYYGRQGLETGAENSSLHRCTMEIRDIIMCSAQLCGRSSRRKAKLISRLHLQTRKRKS
jgi:hypothetical protein